MPVVLDSSFIYTIAIFAKANYLILFCVFTLVQV